MLKCYWGVIMLDEYKDKQKLFFDYISKSVSLGKISHAYFIETNGVSYAKDLAISLAKYFLDTDVVVSDQIDQGNYPEVKIIDSGLEIKKEEILSLQEAFSVKPIYGKYMIYIICDATLLNNSSCNTLLKFLEEPNPHIIAILMAENVNLVKDTIISRCQILSLVGDALSFSNFEKRFEKFSLESALDFYSCLEEDSNLLFANNEIYSFKEDLKLLLETGLYLYSDVLHFLNGNEDIFFASIASEIEKIASKNTKDDIIRKIDVIASFMKNVKYNVNRDLFIDNFVITLGGAK